MAEKGETGRGWVKHAMSAVWGQHMQIWDFGGSGGFCQNDHEIAKSLNAKASTRNKETQYHIRINPRTHGNHQAISILSFLVMSSFSRIRFPVIRHLPDIPLQVQNTKTKRRNQKSTPAAQLPGTANLKTLHTTSSTFLLLQNSVLCLHTSFAIVLHISHAISSTLLYSSLHHGWPTTQKKALPGQKLV